MRPKSFLHLSGCSLCLIGVLVPCQVHAESITFSYQGVIDSVLDDAGGFSAYLGETMKVTYTFESTAPDSVFPGDPDPEPLQGQYPTAISSLKVSVGGNVYTATSGNITVNNGFSSGSDFYSVSARAGESLVGPDIGGISVERFQLTFTDSTGAVFATDALPLTQPDPADFMVAGNSSPPARMELTFTGSDDGELNVSEVFIMPIPEPASCLLIAAGLVALSCCRRDRNDLKMPTAALPQRD